MNYSIRNCGSDRKPWVVECDGYRHPVAAFHEKCEALRYMEKCKRVMRRRNA